MSSDMKFDQGLTLPEILSGNDLKIMLLPEKVRYSLRIKPSDIAAVNKASGLKLPRKIGGSNLGKDQFVMCLGPDEWFVVANVDARDRLEKIFAKLEKSFTLSITDVSHRNICFGLMGADAVKAVNIGCPLDLSLEHFPVGKVTRTVFESAPIILTRTGEDNFGIECWRSFAPYIRGFFERYATDKAAA